MDARFDIPFEWQQGPLYFFTYYGDIYFGRAVSCPNYFESFFIVQNDKLHRLNDLKPEERTPDIYRTLGWEIKDKKIIVLATPYNRNNRFGSEVHPDGISWSSGYTAKKMIVFGAGASSYCVFGDKKDSFKTANLRPPEGFEIFNERFDSILNNYKGALSTVPMFEEKENDIEACLEAEWADLRSSYNPQITTRHINVQFYLADLFRQISDEVVAKYSRNNLYSLFALKLQKYLAKQHNERIGIVSFNYDTILEQFIKLHFGDIYQNMRDYIDWNKNQLTVIKPHGSCNWGWDFDVTKIELQRQIDIATKLYSDNVLPVNLYYNLLGNIKEMTYAYSWGMESSLHPHSLGRYTINKNSIKLLNSNQIGYYPALLMPYRDKDEFIMPYDHHHALQQSLNRVEELYLIGWKGNEEVFNRYVNTYANNLRKIIIVNPDHEKVGESFSKQIPRLKCEIETANTFEEFVRDKMDDIFKC